MPFSDATHPTKPIIQWDTPSANSQGSMPLGNGDIALNVWAESTGEILLYLSKTDSWSEDGRLLKLGRLRFHFSGLPSNIHKTFRQALYVDQGFILIEWGKDSEKLSTKIWVDANHPVVRFEAEGPFAFNLKVSLELRQTEREEMIEDIFHHGTIGKLSQSEPLFVEPDHILDGGENRLLWCHRNESSVWENTLRHQGLESLIDQSSDPLLHRTFGATVQGNELKAVDPKTLSSDRPQQCFRVNIYPLTAQTGALDQWIEKVEKSITQCEQVTWEGAIEQHQQWWKAFQERSWIQLSGSDNAETVSRGYLLQRFMNACAGRGDFPIKFNGNLFTMDGIFREDIPHKEMEGKPYDADFRLWGGGYWFQNTRLIYWSLLKSGDFDLMEPWWKMFLSALPLAKKRAEVYYQIDGAFFPETMAFWGSYLNINYGYDRKGKNPDDVENKYIKRYWQGGLELSAFLLDVYEHTNDQEFLRQKALPLIFPILSFYHSYYTERDKDGKIRFSETQSLETWHHAVNPLPDIAGLQWVLDQLLALPEGTLSPKDRAKCTAFRQELPPLPKRSYPWQKKTKLLPALEYDTYMNMENPELYAVFPYRLFGVGKPGLETGRYTYHSRREKRSGGWHQDGIQAALLGLTEEAQQEVTHNFTHSNPDCRFPAFWGPNYDWIPDMDHGSTVVIALQNMLMQSDRDKIILLPAWPEKWDCDFKLHAPKQTTLTGKISKGKIEKLIVSPEERRKDIYIPNPQNQEKLIPFQQVD